MINSMGLEGRERRYSGESVFASGAVGSRLWASVYPLLFFPALIVFDCSWISKRQELQASLQ